MRLHSSQRLLFGAQVVQLLMGSPALAQTVPDLLPKLTVPNTRGLSFAAETTVVSATLAILGRAMPNEAGVCYYGDIAVGQGQPTVVARRVAAAAGRGTITSFKWEPELGHGCGAAADLVGVGHSHPYSTCESEQSALPESRADTDAALLATDPRVLFSVIWCFGQGRAVLLWQHGGREVVEYLNHRSP